MPVPRLKVMKSTASTSRPFGGPQEGRLLDDGSASKYQTGILFEHTRTKQGKQKKQLSVTSMFKPAQAVEDHVTSLSHSKRLTVYLIGCY